MQMHVEGDGRTDVEQQLVQLRNTVNAIAQETASITLHGPCRSCGQCLVFVKNGRMYCPQCGDGQNV